MVSISCTQAAYAALAWSRTVISWHCIAGYQTQAIHDTALPKKGCGHAENAVGRTYAYCKEASECQGAH